MKKSLPDTHEGNNWTVAVFQCPQDDWTKVLKDFFQFLEPCEECLLPHYTIKAYDPFTISFRILRYERDEIRVIAQLTEFLKDYPHQFDPDDNDRFGQYHQWIHKGQRNEYWTNDRCVTLNKLSQCVLDIITSDTKEKDRVEWGHLFSNMMAIFDVAHIFRSPDIIPPSLGCVPYGTHEEIVKDLRILIDKLEKQKST